MLEAGFFWKDSLGESQWIDFWYDRLSGLCFKCGYLGHEEKACSHVAAAERADCGSWIRADLYTWLWGPDRCKKVISSDSWSSPEKIARRVVHGRSVEEEGNKASNVSLTESELVPLFLTPPKVVVGSQTWLHDTSLRHF